MKKICLINVTLLVCLLFASCSTKEKRSPITSYFNPTLPYVLSSGAQFSDFIVDFVNYPNDLSKLGLQDSVKKVVYNMDIARYEETFNKTGNLEMQYFNLFGGGGKVLFDYNQDGTLKQTYNAVSGYIDGPMANFEYLSSKKPDKNIARNNMLKTFTYYENGNLKGISSSSEWTQKGWAHYTECFLNLECDSKGNPKKMEHYDYKPVIYGFNNAGWTVKEFAHNDNGQCTDVRGIIRPDTRRAQFDSVKFWNNYTYNTYGHVNTWSYGDQIYPSEEKNTFQLVIDYVYDQRGNWTKMVISGSKLNMLYSEESLTTDANGNPLYVMERSIEYYN
ncbi:MAG: hypothetical protein IIW47_01665 [Bacteroidales bacterium]|nr:hypothetical protein [Bacteroidales bacterium]